MSGDIAIVWQDFSGDMKLAGYDLERDAGLRTAVIISLFTDRRANDGDPLPGAPEDKRGWWADSFAELRGDRIGSRLWLLSREKQLQSVVVRARQYAQEALQWLLEDGVAAGVQVSAEIVRTGVLGLQIGITRPALPAINFRFEAAWRAV